ncbi:hypothetical protein [Kineosporia sp. NBRC 101731]|uniref:hypothetical protein n=1 Tax=Kineosporia sp. NBRC 101731 TaxID=3032199 RepID=UPI0024A5EA0C|nr:hypothetical protein [Kineosporia sp. NBRC 101731]GLY31466.1 hypothetical protein Kisp02_48310 [Kineosporia sp. NBRC 101731]
MERPPLSTVLTSVLSAAIENTHRPTLLAIVRPHLRDEGKERPPVDEEQSGSRVIPMPRRAPEHAEQHDPTPAA